MCANIEPLDPVLVAAAWLHDTLEYTDTDESALREHFGEAVSAPWRISRYARGLGMNDVGGTVPEQVRHDLAMTDSGSIVDR